MRTAANCQLGGNDSYQQGAFVESPGTWRYDTPTTTAPEPVTAALVGLGVIVAGLRRTRRG